MAAQPTALIMAAGHGTRMRSSLPKVLHPVCGRPMLRWVIEAAQGAGAARVVCVTRPGDGVERALPDGVEHAEQTEGEGTGAAVLAARPLVEGGGTVLVLSGDHPLITPELIRGLAETHAEGRAAATLLTTEELDPAGYGRIVRGADGGVERIVETKYAERVPAELLAIREVNIGTYAFRADGLFSALDELVETDGEKYLTDAFEVLRSRGERIAAHRTTDTSSAVGVNTRVGLMEVERQAQRRIIESLALSGVSFSAPDSVSVEAGVEIAEDTVVAGGVTLREGTRIGSGCAIGPHTTAVGATIGEGVIVAHSYLLGCEVHDRASIGPFAYLRPGSVIGEGAKIGAFVEVKGSRVGAGAKVPHLSYLGDADVGEGANVAAGNITANYDGRAKHRTKIGKRARTGVHTSLVAPVSVGDGAYTAAGSVITEDVPEGALGISRPEQQNVEGYAERVEKGSGQ